MAKHSCPFEHKDCKCSGIPLERSSKDPVDILFITEFPGSIEAKEKKFLVGQHGKFFREIISSLRKKYDFTYAITGATRSVSRPGVLVHHSPVVQACLPNLLAEVKKCKPRVIIFLGSLPFTLFSKGHSLPKHGDRVEDGRMRVMEIGGSKYPVMFCQHTSWYQRNESCAVGFLYENIRKALDYAFDNITYSIPNKIKTVTLISLKEVKEVLDKFSRSNEYVALDTEGISLSRVYGNKLLSIQLSCDGKVGYLIPYLHKDSPFLDKIDKLNKLLKKFFFGSSTIKGYLLVNAKYDYHQLFKTLGSFSLNAPIIDTSYSQFSLDENWVRVHSYPKGKGHFSLFTMSYKRGFDFYSRTDSKEKRDILEKVPLAEWEEYAAADVISPWLIYRSQMLEAEHTGYKRGFLALNHLYANHLMRILTYTEHCGLAIDKKKVNSLLNNDSVIKSALKDIMDRFFASPNVQKANEILLKGKTGMASGLAGQVRIWSPTSPLHRELLYFKIMELDPITEEDDEDSSSTGKAFQKAYTGTLEVDLLAEFMSFDKMMSGFIKPMSGYLDKNHADGSEDMYTDSRSRTTFYPLAVTGRLRSGKPNQQQRPAGRSKAANEILSMYAPKKGRVVIKLDYKTFEVMGLGFLSGDKVMIQSFTEAHEMKEEYRRNPTVFAQQGYEIEKQALEETRKELKKSKALLLETKGISSKKDYLKLKESYKASVAAYKEKAEKLEVTLKEKPEALSLDYVNFMTDSHKKFASLFFKTPITSVSKSQRQAAKSLVFGCFTEDTIVGTANGPDRLGTLKGKPRVISIERTLKQSQGNRPQGIKPVVMVKTNKACLEGTPDHKVKVITKDCTLEDKALGDLQPNDVVLYQAGMLAPYNDEHMPLDEAYALGQQVNAKTTKIPDSILKSPQVVVSHYLQGVFDKQGNVKMVYDRRINNRGYVIILLSSCDFRFMSEVSWLLHAMGISCRLYYTKTSCELNIALRASVNKFRNLIGFAAPSKKEAFNSCLKQAKSLVLPRALKAGFPFSYSSVKKTFLTACDNVRFAGEEVNQARDWMQKTPSIRELLEGVFFHKKAFSLLGLEEQWKCLFALSVTGAYASKVVHAAEPAGEKEVFDVINVQDTHLWTANGVIVSNCIYGMSIGSIAKNLKISEDEAQELYDKFMKSFPQAASWLAGSKEFGRKHFYVESPLGRRRRLWGHLRQDKSVAGKMDRYAGNTVIQGFCSDCNLIAGSILIDVIENHNKLKYQVPDNKAWFITNLVHDSCEFEIPLEDAYYFIKEVEPVFTDYLRSYIKAVFKFDIKIPIEVDFTVGTNYGNTKDWTGTEQNLKECLTWLCDEVAKRDGTEPHSYKQLIRSPLYKEHEKGAVFEVVKGVIRRDKERAKQVGYA